MAHAIHGYSGACKNIHGHSYELHVTVGDHLPGCGPIPAPGFITDFKIIKKIVTSTVVEKLDHKLVLSEDFLRQHPGFAVQENLVTWKKEPTAENLLCYIHNSICAALPPDIKLLYLKLFETKDSYAEWLPDNTFIPY